MLGSVSGALAASAPGPVAVVPAGARTGDPRRVVVGVSTDDAGPQLDLAFAEAQQRSCPLEVVHALEADPPVGLDLGGPDVLVEAVRTVASGGSMLDPRAAARVMERLRADAHHAPDPLAGLTEQEHRILVLIGRGLTNRQIGADLFLAEKTVKNYVSRIFAKLGLERRAQAAVLAARLEREEHPRG